MRMSRLIVNLLHKISFRINHLSTRRCKLRPLYQWGIELSASILFAMCPWKTELFIHPAFLFLVIKRSNRIPLRLHRLEVNPCSRTQYQRIENCVEHGRSSETILSKDNLLHQRKASRDQRRHTEAKHRSKNSCLRLKRRLKTYFTDNHPRLSKHRFRSKRLSSNLHPSPTQSTFIKMIILNQLIRTNIIKTYRLGLTGNLWCIRNTVSWWMLYNFEDRNVLYNIISENEFFSDNGTQFNFLFFPDFLI